MIWTHNDNWLISADNRGVIKYWQASMTNVKAFPAHNESIRDLGISITDNKFASCSDDKLIKIWDFVRCEAESTLEGHGWDVKSISWHPFNSLLLSGGKDQHVKLWDTRTAKELQSLYTSISEILSLTNSDKHIQIQSTV